MRLAAALALAVCACASGQGLERSAGGAAPPGAKPADAGVAQRPLGVVDLHVDLPFAMASRGRTLFDADAEAGLGALAAGQVDLVVLPLVVEGAPGLPAAVVRARYEELAAMTERAFADPRAGGVRYRLAFEGADGFADAPEALAGWVARGACFVGPTHLRTNRLAGSSQEPDRRARTGLTLEGRAVVRAAMRAGGVVDVAHASDAALADILALASEEHAVLVDSHTGVRALRDIERNLSDEGLRAIARTGGVVGISLHGGHVGSRPGWPPTLGDIAAHVLHALELAGPAHVAIGSDLEGGIEGPEAACGRDGGAPPGAQPRDAGGPAQVTRGAGLFPCLAAELRARGVQESTLRAVFRENALRVLRGAEARGCGRRAVR